MQHAESIGPMDEYYDRVFGLDLPLWQQYVNYWDRCCAGTSASASGSSPPRSSEVISGALPYSLGLLLPAILLSWVVGNRIGALAARR